MLQVKVNRTALNRDNKGGVVGFSSIITDVTERKQVEEALRKSEMRYKTLVELSPEAVYVHHEGIIVYINPAGTRIFGATDHEEIVGKPVLDFIHPDYHEIVKRRMEQIYQERTAIPPAELKYIRLDNKAIDVVATATYIDFFGNPSSLSVIRDITDQKLAEESLRESEEKYRSLITNIPDVTWTTDQKFKTIFVSPNSENMFGYTPEEIYESGNNVFPERIHPEDAGRMKEAFEKLFEHGTTFDVEFRIKRKNGEWIWVHDKSIAVYERDGVKYADGIFSNITSRKQAEQQKELKTRILDTINQSVNWKESIEDVLNNIKEFSGFEAVAIRLREGEDYPYYVTQGFPAHFVEAERYLCSRDSKGEITRDSEGNPYVECMCGNVICGRTDQEKDFFTEGGSFWSNSTSKLLSETTDEDRQTRTRNRCNSEGYESVALIPLKAGNQIVGRSRYAAEKNLKPLYTPKFAQFRANK